MKQLDLQNIITSLEGAPDEAKEEALREKKEKKGRRQRVKRTCTEAAIDILSRRNVSEAMMVEKLTAKKYSEEDIAHTMSRLLEMNYLNDEAYAKGRVEYRKNVSNWGWWTISFTGKQK